MDIRDYYKEHYCLEATRKNDLTNALSLPLGILSLLIGGLAVVAQGVHVPLNSMTILQLALMAVAVVFVLRTAYFLARSYYNYAYGYVPTPLEIKRFKEALVAYYVTLGETLENAVRKADIETLEHIDEEYAKHTDRNTKNNNSKSSFIHKANGALIGTIISTLAIGVAYLAISITTASEPQKVEIINLKEIKMPVPTNTTPPVEPAAPKTTQTPTPTKPTPPPGQVLKEHVDPSRNK